jgi:hypothetical protein
LGDPPEPEFASEDSFDPELSSDDDEKPIAPDHGLDSENDEDAYHERTYVLEYYLGQITSYRKEIKQKYVDPAFDQRMSQVMNILSTVEPYDVEEVSSSNIQITDEKICYSLCHVFPSLIGAEKEPTLPGDVNELGKKFMALLRSLLPDNVKDRQISMRRNDQINDIEVILQNKSIFTNIAPYCEGGSSIHLERILRNCIINYQISCWLILHLMDLKVYVW